MTDYWINTGQQQQHNEWSTMPWLHKCSQGKYKIWNGRVLLYFIGQYNVCQKPNGCFVDMDIMDNQQGGGGGGSYFIISDKSCA